MLRNGLCYQECPKFMEVDYTKKRCVLNLTKVLGIYKLNSISHNFIEINLTKTFEINS